jgi:hypothetical protein
MRKNKKGRKAQGERISGMFPEKKCNRMDLIGERKGRGGGEVETTEGEVSGTEERVHFFYCFAFFYRIAFLSPTPAPLLSLIMAINSTTPTLPLLPTQIHLPLLRQLTPYLPSSVSSPKFLSQGRPASL